MDECIHEIHEKFPEAFWIKEDVIKVYSQRDNFCKFMQNPLEIQKYLLDKIGITYLWYLELLINTLNYDGIIDFKALKRLWIKQWMIDTCKKKLIDSWIVKKFDGDFYRDPKIAVKWETVNPNLYNLF